MTRVFERDKTAMVVMRRIGEVHRERGFTPETTEAFFDSLRFSIEELWGEEATKEEKKALKHLLRALETEFNAGLNNTAHEGLAE